MRSRFSAFATGDARYLRASWHRSTRPTRLDLDPDQVWFRLTILQARGGPQDETGTVEFVAQYRNPDGRGRLHERSRFTRQDGCWVYLDGESG